MTDSPYSSYPPCQSLPEKTGFVLESPAKINLALRILGRRADGYHDIETIFQEISLADHLEFRSGKDWRLTCTDEGLDCGETNLVTRAAHALAQATGHAMLGAVHLVKRIPIGGGLGGGSSNAAVGLLGLCRLWDLEVNRGLLEEIASEVGADCPFFLRGGLAFARGRGEQLEWLPGAVRGTVLLVWPGFAVRTGWAYENAEVSLTKGQRSSILKNCIHSPDPLRALGHEAPSDLESAVFDRFPELGRIKMELHEAGAEFAALSGSGATLFGIFQNPSRAEQAAQLFRDRYETFICSPVARPRSSSPAG